MKILRIDNSSPENPVLMADSAYRPDRRPLFLPDTEGCPLKCSLKVAVIIDRLGKCISRRFASRYVGALQMVNIMVGPSLNNFSDDTVIHGPRFEVPQDKVVFNCIPGGEVSFIYPREYVESLVERLSRHATFKTGDIIILPDEIISYTPSRDMNVSVSLDGASLLEFSVK